MYVYGKSLHNSFDEKLEWMVGRRQTIEVVRSEIKYKFSTVFRVNGVEERDRGMQYATCERFYKVGPRLFSRPRTRMMFLDRGTPASAPVLATIIKVVLFI